MHQNPVFRQATDERNLAFARQRGFGVLSINNPAGDVAPLFAHIPFDLSADGRWMALHLMRSNPIVRALAEPVSAVVAVSGADSYISPDWYKTPDQVPTWNYVAVHLRGRLSLLPQKDLPALIKSRPSLNSAFYPKPPGPAIR